MHTSIQKNNQVAYFILLSPILVILIGYITARIFSEMIAGWAWVPLAIVYWSVLGILIYKFKGEHTIKDWLKKPKSAKGWTTLSFIFSVFTMSILIMQYHLFESALFVILWLLFAIINPWFEELYWRGLLLDTAVKRMPKWIATIFVTTFFVLSHPLMWGVFSVANRSYHLYIYLTVISIIWIITYFKTKSLRFIILCHFIVDIGNLAVLTFLNIYIP